ncbi:phosphodiester glycosidase family protein [Leucobacter aridicollis]|uniref:3',5'-cyclic AMP phosphodiesterase CpdA n=1 Tax=Leucobacter aridicollis TaxID=283878 RepID=A0A852R5R0_9MICO|nr:phosphodiester glycosidase family protein [Leucobacter aridicollis]MBL3682383.1 hypothetical protein [Leucobacter aridicollis]NYD25799.1 3',5'-cyclic AMP phosphodiesterase CpdA [Leucobacter aridicollis]
MAWFRRTPLTTTLAAGLCLGIAVGGITLAPQSALTASYAAPDTGGLDLGGRDSSLLRAETRQLAPGLKATSFDRLQGEGWVTGDVLIADLGTPTLSMDVRDSGSLTRPAPVTEHTLGEHAVAAVNGSFFDINNSGVAQGTNVSSSEGVKTTSGSPVESFTLSGGIAAIQALASAATLEIGGATHDVSTVNNIGIPANGIGYFTPMWGEYPVARAIGGPSNIDPKFLRVEVADGVVTRISSDLAEITGPTAIAAGTGVVLARGDAVDLFAGVKAGDALPVTVAASSDVDLAISGNQRLVIDGAVVAEAGKGEPRTAVGVSADGSTVYVVSLDGRQSHSRGMALDELGEFMVELGAHNAVNLDGGGSSTLLMREPGTDALSVGNAPSDGHLRSVPNSLVFSSTAPDTGLVDVMVAPAPKLDDADAVFPGFSRTVSGIGLDANRGALATVGEFSVTGDNATLAAVDADTAKVTGVAPGTAPVTFTAEGKSATRELRVLGDLDRLRASQSVIALVDENGSETVTITGLDKDGFSAPIEASDLTVSAGADVSVESLDGNTFTITPRVASGAATVSFSAGDRRVDVAVTVGLEEAPVSDLANAKDWTFRADRATGEIAQTTGPNGEAALKLTYDFASSTGTRGAYAVAPEPIEIAGQPKALKMWVHGDGNSTWPRLQMKTGAGTTMNIDGPHTSWTGWQELTFNVPVGTAYPLKLERVRMMETSAAKQYTGETAFAGIRAVVAPEVAQPESPVVHDPLVVTNGTVDKRAQRIAVMSDAQFVARNPEGANVQGARQTLREILAAKPEMFVITGDFVDEAAPEDFDLARKILDEEIGNKLPWVYVPGNHEVMGGPIENFIAEFGPTKTKQQVGGTLVITLNTANGNFNSSDKQQMRFLEDALAEAENDSTITGVLVFAHHPVDDPKSSKDSQISDRIEAKRYQDRLAQFRADTGKSIASINGHAGVFHATSHEGVSTFLSGNSGKSPSSSPDKGGFTGWAMLGINPNSGVVGHDPAPVTSRTNWLQTEVKPRVDEVTLGASAAVPSAMTVGDTVTVDATISQDGGRIVPVQWPMSAVWDGEAVVIDDGAVETDKRGIALSASVSESAAESVVRFNPSTGALTATGAGQATLAVTVNGVTSEHTIEVSGDTTGPVDPGGPGESEGPGESGDGGDNGSGTKPGTGSVAGPGAGSEGEHNLAATGGHELQWTLAAVLVSALLTVGGLLVFWRRRSPNS